NWIDCDPYVSVALLCKNYDDWEMERSYELRTNVRGISELENRFPDFYSRIANLRERMSSARGFSPRILGIDYGKVLWADFGLHVSLRQNLQAMLDETNAGQAFRDIFGLSHVRDNKGNIIVRSRVPYNCNIHDSIIVDTVITDNSSLINRGVIVG